MMAYEGFYDLQLILLICMFLSKKNAIYLNKPKTNEGSKPKRILAGWDDEEQQKNDHIDYTIKVQTRTNLNNLLIGDDFTDLSHDKIDRSQNKEKFYLSWDQLDEKTNIQCQKRLVEQIVQPGGIRIKPNDNMLSEFFKETKGMQVHIIGSLLLSKLEANYSFQIKAKALYVIEFIIKKSQNYLGYFKAHVEKINQFPEPEDNVENYRKILKMVLNFIGISNPTQKTYEKQVFVDPGYNEDPKSKLSSFIQQNAINKTKKTQTKKTIIGPGQLKANKVVQEKPKTELSDLDFLSFGDNNSNSNNNNSSIPSKGPQLNFQQLMGDINFNNSNLAQQRTNPAANNNINLLF